jgi:thioredoxin-like negative regulator of GroEL
MNSVRNNPDSEENQRMSRDNERAVFAAKMQAKNECQVEDEIIDKKASYIDAALDEAEAKRYRRRNKKAAKLLHDLNKCGGNIQQVPKKLRHIFTNEIDPEKL